MAPEDGQVSRKTWALPVSEKSPRRCSGAGPWSAGWRGKPPSASSSARRHHRGEAERPEARQDHQEGVRYCGRPGREQAGHRDEGEAVGAEPLDGRGTRRDGVAVHREDTPIVGGVDQRRQLAPEGVHVRVDDAFGERRSYRGVERVAPGMQDAEPRLRREVVLARHHAASAQQRRPLWHRAPSLSPGVPGGPAGGDETPGCALASVPAFFLQKYRISGKFPVASATARPLTSVVAPAATQHASEQENR